MQRILFALLPFLAAVYAIARQPAETALACTCFWPAERADRFDSAETVFYGRVVAQDRAVRENPPSATVPQVTWTVDRTRFTVERVWRGPASGEVEVTTPLSNCVLSSFEVGREYVVWASRIGGGNWLYAGIGYCDRDTRPGPIRPGQEDYEFLEQQRNEILAAGEAWQPPSRVRLIAGRPVQFPADAFVTGYSAPNAAECALSSCATHLRRMIVTRGRSVAWVDTNAGTFEERTAEGEERAFDFLRDAFLPVQ